MSYHCIQNCKCVYAYMFCPSCSGLPFCRVGRHFWLQEEAYIGSIVFNMTSLESPSRHFSHTNIAKNLFLTASITIPIFSLNLRWNNCFVIAHYKCKELDLPTSPRPEMLLWVPQHGVNRKYHAAPIQSYTTEISSGSKILSGTG